MALKSMTGFGRAEAALGRTSWVWELRSVNGRSLDVRLRLPPGFEALEPRVRERVQARLVRGSLQAGLSVKRTEGAAHIRINPDAMAAVARAANEARRLIEGDSRINVDGLLAMRGVLDYGEDQETEAETEARAAAMLASLDQALADLVAARESEGGRLAAVLSEQISDVERLVAEAAAAPSRRPEQIASRLKQQVERLAGAAGASLDPARLHQEAIILATRIDIEEEIKRLGSHIAAVRELLAAREAAGRKLDFLTQELNREANTLCSKGNDLDVTRPGLALKAVIDQMREQVQNIE